jgi:uncharacterized protein (TIGR02757 family)
MNDFVNPADLKAFLELKYEKFNNPSFIENDPILIPHCFTRKEDIEISGFLTATIAWGMRKSIINSARKIMNLMDMSPAEFVFNCSEKELERFRGTGHRTFMDTDLIFFIKSLKNIYQNHGGIETVFNSSDSIFEGMIKFHKLFFSIEHLQRTRKHLADVSGGAAAKRLCMYLRWMVRKDNRGVDFGIWKQISPADLFVPLDVHTGNISRKLGLLTRKQNDWKAVLELTEKLRVYDSDDPVKYDFALFGIGVNEDF